MALGQLSRRDALKSVLGLGAAGLLRAQKAPLIHKKIPSTGEALPAVGIGTARRYDVGPDAPERKEIREVLRLFSEMGGRVIDTAPSYGTAETVVGDLVSDLGIRSALFLVTKVNARGREAGIQQLEQSCARLKTNHLDALAVHNLTDTATQLATLRAWKQEGRTRYVGVTTSFDAQYDEFERVIRTEKLDFVQVDYALDDRVAGERLIPAAADHGMAVMVNLPFGRGRLFQAVQNQKLPDWAAEIDCKSWAQVFLKYLVSHPGVTIVVPGTAQVKYVADNLGGAQGRMPDAAMRKRMEQFIDSVKG